MSTGNDPRLIEVRSELPVLGVVNYLNTGSAGPLPRVVADAVAEAATAQVAEPRTGSAYYERVEAVKDACRAAVAGMLGCLPTEIALTHNTTEGMNFVSLGVNWVPGDEAVTTNVEHQGALLPLWVVKERYGVTVKTADLLSAPCDPVDAVVRLITPRTKLVSLSHVSYSTGDVLPIAEIVAEAHERGVLVLVDGAQSFGALPVDVVALGADFYSVPGQKWLCGPEGTGALYSSQAAVSQIRTTFASYGTVDAYNDYGGFLVRPDGRRFEQGTVHLPDLAGHLAALEWMSRAVGDRWAHRRIHDLAASARTLLAGVEGVEVVTGNDHAGLVTFRIIRDGAQGMQPDDLVRELARRSILIRSIERLAALRLSMGFFNTADELVDAVDAVSELVRTS